MSHVNKDGIIGVYPGTFDPITVGHIDIVERSLKFVDKLYLGVAESTHKQSTMFTADERVEIAIEALKEKLSPEQQLKVEVVKFSTLLIEFANNYNATIIIRGLRNMTDFEFENQLAGINSYMSREIEMIFMMAKDKHKYISSSAIRELARLDGDMSYFVTDNVVSAIHKKLKGE